MEGYIGDRQAALIVFCQLEDRAFLGFQCGDAGLCFSFSNTEKHRLPMAAAPAATP